MGYLAAHPFEPHRESADYCGVPDPDFGGGCVKRPEHPIHLVARPDVEGLARALASERWGGSHERDEHRRHRYLHSCALCTKDVHTIAAFVIDYLKGNQP